MNIFAEAARLEEQNRPFALAQIVESRGSTPRHSAQMLIREDGSIVGTIGGGMVSIYAASGLYVNGTKVE